MSAMCLTKSIIISICCVIKKKLEKPILCVYEKEMIITKLTYTTLTQYTYVYKYVYSLIKRRSNYVL